MARDGYIYFFFLNTIETKVEDKIKNYQNHIRNGRNKNFDKCKIEEKKQKKYFFLIHLIN